MDFVLKLEREHVLKYAKVRRFCVFGVCLHGLWLFLFSISRGYVRSENWKLCVFYGEAMSISKLILPRPVSWNTACRFAWCGT